MIKSLIGERIRNIRNIIGISQDELAQKINLDKTYLCRVENGKQNITIDNLSLICFGLGVSLKYFFDVFDEIVLSKEVDYE